MTSSAFIKSTFIVCLLGLISCCATAKPPGIQGSIVNYGIFTFTDSNFAIKNTPETASGITRIPIGKPVLVTTTNRIPAKLGLRFGLTYYVVNLPVTNGYVDITKIAKHPTIKKPDGTS